MRRILVENARRRRSEKHGGRLRRIDFEAAEPLAEPPADEVRPRTSDGDRAARGALLLWRD
jgi:hypothetical protein